MYYGYGVDLEKLNREKTHLRELLSYLPTDLKESYKEYLADNEQTDSEEIFADFVDGYLSEYDTTRGLSALLADLIFNYDQIIVFSEESCLYLTPAYPWQIEENMKNLSLEKYEFVVRKWINIITDEELEFEPLEFED